MCDVPHSPTTESSPLKRLADAYVPSIIGFPFDEWLAMQRKSGHSYEAIANRLSALTDGTIDVSYVTIKRWLDALEKAS